MTQPGRSCFRHRIKSIDPFISSFIHWSTDRRSAISRENSR